MSSSKFPHKENKCNFCCFRHSCDRRHCCFDHHDCCDYHERCCPPFNLNLGGLTGNMNFQFFKFKGCKVEICFECNGKTGTVKGRICGAGTDFVNILTKPGCFDSPCNAVCAGSSSESSNSSSKFVVTIPIHRICDVKWLEHDCGPCKRRHCDPWDMED